MPKEPIVASTPDLEFDSLVVDPPIARANEPTVSLTGDSQERKR
jgi:hypothetical protein